MKIDLANQTKGVLPAANCEGLTQALIDIGTLQGTDSNLETIATTKGYISFSAMVSILMNQIEANRLASGAAAVPGYIP